MDGRGLISYGYLEPQLFNLPSLGDYSNLAVVVEEISSCRWVSVTVNNVSIDINSHTNGGKVEEVGNLLGERVEEELLIMQIGGHGLN